MALLVGELFARITSDSSAARRDMAAFDAASATTARKVDTNTKKVEAAHQRQTTAVTKAVAAEKHHQIAIGGTVAALSALPSAAGGAAGAIGGAAAASGVAFAALAGVLLRENERVADAYSGLAETVVSGAERAAQDSAGSLTKIAHHAAAQFRSIEPEINRLFTNGSRQAAEFSDAAGDAVADVVRGLDTLVERGEPAVKGVSNLMRSVGRGGREMLDELSGSTESFGRNLTSLGVLAEAGLGTTGRLIAQLSDDGAGAFERLTTTGTTALHTIEGLSSGGFPVLAATASGALSATNGLLTALQPLDAALGGIGATVLSGALAWRIYNRGLAPAGNAMAGAGEKLGGLSQRLAANEGSTARLSGATSRLGSVFSRVGAAIPVLGAGLVGVGMVIDAQATKYEKAHLEGRNLAQGFTEGGAAALASANKVESMTSEIGRLQAAEVQWKRTHDTTMGTQELDAMVSKRYELTEALGESQRELDKLRGSLTPAETAQLDFNLAVAQFGPSSREAAAAASVWNTLKEQDAQRSQEAAIAARGLNEATAATVTGYLAAASADLTYRGSMLSSTEAQNDLTDARKASSDTLRDHGAKSVEYRDALVAEQTAILNVEAAQLQQIDAARQAAVASAMRAGSTNAAAEGDRAAIVATLDLAAATNGSLTPAMASAVGSMDATALAAAGATRTIDGTGQAVIRLPDGKTITTRIEDLATPVLETLRSNASIPIVQRVVIETTSINRQINEIGGYTGSVNGQPVYHDRNDGGWIGGPSRSGPSKGADSEFLHATPGEFVVRRDRAYLYADLLERINDGGGVLAGIPAQRGVPAASAGVRDLRPPLAAAAPATSQSTKNVNVVLNAIPGIQTAAQLRAMEHEMEVLYGV